MAEIKFLTFTSYGRSHSIGTRYGFGGEASTEEVYFTVTGSWLGKEFKLDLRADRYVASGDDGDRWGDWRVVASAYQDSSEALRAALRQQAEPEIHRWLDSDEYRLSRQRAFFWLVVRLIRDERTGVETLRQEFARHRPELSDRDARKLYQAIDHLDSLLTLTREPSSV